MMELDGDFPGMIIFIISLTLVLGVGLMVLDQVRTSPDYTYAVCCNMTPCSDVYLDNSTNKCVMTECLDNPYIAGNECVYEPHNITALSYEDVIA